LNAKKQKAYISADYADYADYAENPKNHSPQRTQRKAMNLPMVELGYVGFSLDFLCALCGLCGESLWLFQVEICRSPDMFSSGFRFNLRKSAQSVDKY
jgi:hypothetical protein